MEFFLSLYDIGLSHLISFANLVLGFFGAPTIEVISLGLYRVSGRKEITFKLLVDFLRSLGINLEVPLYVFLLENIAFLLGFLMLLKFLDLLN